VRIFKILKVADFQLRTFKFSTCGIAVADQEIQILVAELRTSNIDLRNPALATNSIRASSLWFLSIWKFNHYFK